jgi:neutral ceramidase
MKHLGISVYEITLGLILIFFLSSCSVVKTPYFKTSYYQNTVSRLDSLKPEIITSKDTLYAGFSRINITPDLNKNYDKKKEAKHNIVPLAGYGNRKGKPAEIGRAHV